MVNSRGQVGVASMLHIFTRTLTAKGISWFQSGKVADKLTIVESGLAQESLNGPCHNRGEIQTHHKHDI